MVANTVVCPVVYLALADTDNRRGAVGAAGVAGDLLPPDCGLDCFLEDNNCITVRTPFTDCGTGTTANCSLVTTEFQADSLPTKYKPPSSGSRTTCTVWRLRGSSLSCTRYRRTRGRRQAELGIGGVICPVKICSGENKIPGVFKKLAEAGCEAKGQ